MTLRATIAILPILSAVGLTQSSCVGPIACSNSSGCPGITVCNVAAGHCERPPDAAAQVDGAGRDGAAADRAAPGLDQGRHLDARAALDVGAPDQRACKGCLVGASCYAAGAINPRDVCERCMPVTSRSKWTLVIRPCVSTLAGTGKDGARDGPAATATFSSPLDVAVGPPGATVYVADLYNNRIRAIRNGVVSTVVGAAGRGFADGAYAKAKLNNPTSLVVTATGDIFVADRYNFRIRRLSAGRVSTVAGSGKRGKADGSASVASFVALFGLARDGAGTLYLADADREVAPGAGVWSSLIRRLKSGIVDTLTGRAGVGHVDGTTAAAKTRGLGDMALGASGTLYVADAGNHSVRAVFGGRVTTFAGTGTAGFADGLNAKAEFRWPTGVAVGPLGELYIADTNNHRIRMSVRGSVTTLAGSGTAGHVDGPAAGARFRYPGGLAVDSAGFIYVADGSNRIRLIRR